MTYFDYKVIPAPRRVKRLKGVHDPAELFAHTLTDAINEQAREGWEYVRAESLTAETPKGWFRRGGEEEQAVLVFRRQRETLGPRIAAVTEPVETVAPQAQPSDRDAADANIFADRVAAKANRREPTLGTAGNSAPLRPAPRLGPADRV